MEIIKNIIEGEFWLEGEVFFNLFNKDIALSVEDTGISFAKKCAEYLNNLPHEVIEHLCEASIRYCNKFLEAIGEPKKEFNKPSDVLPLIHPGVLIVPDPEISDNPVIHLELNCEWEEEHGMEWVIRDNKVLYVGAFNGDDPLSDFSEKQSWNYA